MAQPAGFEPSFRHDVPTGCYGQGPRDAAKPAPDVIVFYERRSIDRNLERATGDSFVFKSDVVGEVTVSADKIKELRAAASLSH